MPLWLIDIIVGLVMRYGKIDEDHQLDILGYRWGHWTLIDNMATGNLHLLWKDKTIFDM